MVLHHPSFRRPCVFIGESDPGVTFEIDFGGDAVFGNFPGISIRPAVGLEIYDEEVVLGADEALGIREIALAG